MGMVSVCLGFCQAVTLYRKFYPVRTQDSKSDFQKKGVKIENFMFRRAGRFPEGLAGFSWNLVIENLDPNPPKSLYPDPNQRY
jgi:hypothetical protein